MLSGGGHAAIVAALLLALLRPLSATEFEFTGPAPTRNYAPLQLLFLNLPFERAATIEPGGLALRLDTAESSAIATHDGAIVATVKFETNRTVFGFRYGLLPRLEAGMELPFISRYGGMLDPIIDGVEHLFNAENPERKLFPENSFGGFIVMRGTTILFDAGEENFQPGDLSFLAKYELPLPASWPVVSVRSAIKAPTGNAGAALGSGKPDLGAGLAVDYLPWHRLMLYFNANLVYPLGPITAGDLTLNPIVSESFAAHLAITRRWSAMLHQATYTSPFHGTHAALLDGTVVELGFGFAFAFSPKFSTQLLGIQNVSGVEQSADFTLLLSMVFQPWAHPTALPPLDEGPPLPPPPIGESPVGESGGAAP